MTGALSLSLSLNSITPVTYECATLPPSFTHSFSRSFISPNSQSPWGVLPWTGAECDEEISPSPYAGVVCHTSHCKQVLRSKAERWGSKKEQRTNHGGGKAGSLKA